MKIKIRADIMQMGPWEMQIDVPKGWGKFTDTERIDFICNVIVNNTVRNLRWKKVKTQEEDK